MSKKLIYTAYSPNSRDSDIRLNRKLLFKFYGWYKGDAGDRIKQYFESYYPDRTYYSFNYARSALYFIFLNSEHQDGDEVIYQGFTCAAASLPAIWAGYKPIYVDIEDSNLSPTVESIKKAITDRTRFIVVQYTFGYSSDVESLYQLAREKNILLIEDCTHFLPSDNDKSGILPGSTGDYAVFSFGRDKVVSGVDGGVLLAKNGTQLKSEYEKLEYPNRWWLTQRLLFPLIWGSIKRHYFSYGKLLHLLTTKLGILSKATTAEEKAGVMPNSVGRLLPNSLAELALRQIDDINEIQQHRERISAIYREGLKSVKGIELLDLASYPHLRFPIFSDNRDELMKFLEENRIIAGDWYWTPVAPVSVPYSVSGYIAGSCKNAEQIADQIINLPTHINISVDDANYIVKMIVQFSKN